MSTRVFLPVGGFFNYNRMSEFRRRLEPPTAAQRDASQEVEEQSENASLQPRTVRRNLFGPIDHDENVKFVQEELAKIAAADRRRWNFDFQNDRPLDGRYSWEATRGGQVPVAYNMPNLTAKLTLPNTYPSTSKVTNVISLPTSTNNSAASSRAKSENENSSVSPLRSTITTVTTATTTVMSVCPKNNSEISLETNPKSTSQQPNIESNIQNSQSQIEPSSTQHKANSKNTKQPKITEYMKIRKRSHSTDSKIESDDTPLPSLKRAKTSS